MKSASFLAFVFFNEHETEVLVLFPKPSLLRLANDFQIPCKWEVFINIDTHTYIHKDKWHHSLLCYFWNRPSFIMPCLCNSRAVVDHDLNRQSSSPSEEMGEKMKHKWKAIKVLGNEFSRCLLRAVLEMLCLCVCVCLCVLTFLLLLLIWACD